MAPTNNGDVLPLNDDIGLFLAAFILRLSATRKRLLCYIHRVTSILRQILRPLSLTLPDGCGFLYRVTFPCHRNGITVGANVHSSQIVKIYLSLLQLSYETFVRYVCLYKTWQVKGGVDMQMEGS